MAFLYITEFSILPRDEKGIPCQGMGESGAILAKQKIANDGVSVASATFNAQTKFVRLHSDSICSVNFGGAGVAAAVTDQRMSANQTEYWGVNSAGITKVAAILNT